MKVEPKLRLLIIVVFVLLGALFLCEERYNTDEVMFNAVYGLLTGFSAILLNELRKELGQEQLPPPPLPGADRVKTTMTQEQTISQPPPPAHTP